MVDFFEEDTEGSVRKITRIRVYSVLAGTGLTILGILLYLIGLRQLGWAIALIGVVTGTVPYGIITFLRTRAVSEIEDQFPNFLKDLAESKKSGMNLVDAFESARESDYGRLNNEIEKMHNQLTWGVPFPKVMQRFSNRLEGSSVIQEATSILLQSFKSGGSITETVESVGDNINQLKTALGKKDSMIKQQVVVMYVIYFIFIAITVGIYMILVQLLGLGEPGSGALGGAEFAGIETDEINFCSGEIAPANPMCEMAQLFGFVPADVVSFTSEYAEEYDYGNMAYYKSILFSMLIIQGILNGLVIGQISEGKPSAGLKHIMLLLPIAFVIFMALVGRAGV